MSNKNAVVDVLLTDVCPTLVDRVNGVIAKLRTVTVTSTTTTPFTLADHDVVAFDCTAGAKVANLPAYSVTLSPVGDVYMIVKTDASGNSAGVAPNGSETINGSGSTITTTTQWDRIEVTRISSTAWVRTR